jgi:hypothetical protein
VITQRKIHHLLADNGETGHNFRYLPELNSIHKFDWNDPIILTDKIDGTTVQAADKRVFKRKDKFKKGDPRKREVPPGERYELVEIFPDAPEWRWVFEAYDRYKPIFKRLFNRFTVYFEAFGPKINKRYRGMDHHDLRVFDIVQPPAFVFGDFVDVVDFCTATGLPCVGRTSMYFKGFDTPQAALYAWLHDTDAYIEHSDTPELDYYKHADPLLEAYELEGYVLRQGSEIAKIRKSDFAILDWEGSL